MRGYIAPFICNKFVATHTEVERTRGSKGGRNKESYCTNLQVSGSPNHIVYE